jgi:phosphatidylglycerol:prolipoprotein diacylglycerol transferase
MRKVLLRFVYDDYWMWQSSGNELLVGVGWLLIAWAVIAIIALTVTWKLTRDTAQLKGSALMWLIVPAFVVLVQLLNLPLANSGIPVFGYGFMMFVGFSTATLLAARRIRTVGLPTDVIWDLMMWLLVPGLIGARIVYLSQNWQNVMAGKQGGQKLVALVSLWDGGIVFYGCIIGGAIGLLAFCRRRQLDPVVLLDVIAPSLFVGEGFGRIGCFLYGCCFGHQCNLAWSVQFPRDSLTFEKLVERGTIPPDALQTVPLHPTQLYSSAAAFLLAFFLAWLFRRRTFDGLVIAMAWILYPINRYILEIYRDDEPGRLGTSQTFSQLMSIGLIVTGIIALIWFSKRGRLTTIRTTPSQSTSPGGSSTPSGA